MKKKFLILTLFSLSCGLALTGVACNDNGSDSSSSSGLSGTGEFHTLTFTVGDGFEYVGDGIVYDEENGTVTARAEGGLPFTFTLDVDPFYTGTPTVFAGNAALSATTEGIYTLNVSGDVTITTNGIVKDVSDMYGSGEFDDAYVVSRPIDLLYIADRVNAGDPEYTSAYYILANDIDCKGAELEIIGDGSVDENGDVVGIFGGCFTCYTNPDTGEMERYTISNFVINSDDANYVGLFGCVQANFNQSSGLFYGICIDDFEINVSANPQKLAESNRTVYCGSLIGYGIGVNAYLCEATNGKINMLADSNEFSFVGGLIGVQQGYYWQEYNTMLPSEVAYSHSDVNILILGGSVLYGGGLTGHLFTNSYVAPAYILNSYARGNVNGAMRAGGLVGGLGQYTSVSSSYATGNVTANVKISASTDGYLPEYCMAYAGGVVGYAENDTIANECFATGKISAKAADGANSQKMSKTIAGGDEAYNVSVASQKYRAVNCLDSVDMATLNDTLKDKFGWNTYNWVFNRNDYPTIYYGSSSESITTTITVKYVTHKADGSTEAVKVDALTGDSFGYQDSYAPIVDAFNNGNLALYLTSDDKTMLSYGYFFDEACTDPVPYSYVTTKNITLYIGFTDPTPIVGTYLLNAENAQSKITLTFTADGTAVYSDGAVTDTVNYQYNGKTVLLEGARLARYYFGAVDSSLSVNEDELFDMNRYIYYYFNAIPTDTGFDLYDGIYFTADKPLSAYDNTQEKLLQGAYYSKVEGLTSQYVFRPDGTGTITNKEVGIDEFRKYELKDGIIEITLSDDTKFTVAKSALREYDAFKGTWTRSATVNKTYYFDGMGNWKYIDATVKGAPSSTGTYEVNDDGDVLTFAGTSNTATFNTEGFLIIDNGTVEQLYYDSLSYKGVWKNTRQGVTLTLNGVNEAGLGVAKVSYANGYNFNLTYEVSEMPTATGSYVCLYSDGAVFGYFTYDTTSQALQAVVYDPAYADTYNSFTLSPVNAYDGVWISNDTNVDSIEFEGLGSYVNGNWEGYVTIKGDRVKYTLEGSTLSGYFDHEGVRYTIAFNDETGEINISYANNTTPSTLERKDQFADLDFLDKTTYKRFAFNGKGNLAEGGILTVDGETEYVYKKSKTNQDYEVFAKGDLETRVGVVQNKGSYFELTFEQAEETYELYVRNDYMGIWAMSGAFESFVIGPTDANGYITGTFQNQDILISNYSANILTFSCEIKNMPSTYYLYLFYDEDSNGNATDVLETIVLSQYADLSYGSYTICSRVDSMFGTWTQKEDANKGDSDFTITFDGVQCDYSNGTAYLSYKGSPTAYYYKVYANGGILLWSQNLQNERTTYYKIKWCEAEIPAGAYENGSGKAFILEESDSLYMTQAKDASGVVYTFDGNNLDLKTPGTLTASNGKTYSYVILSFNENSTATITLVELNVSDPKTYTATLDYSNNSNIKLTLVEVESEEAA